MVRIYGAALGATAIFLSYFIGMHISNIKCRERIAESKATQIVIDTKIMENINEAVFHTSVGDIRRILCEKYTIAE